MLLFYAAVGHQNAIGDKNQRVLVGFIRSFWQSDPSQERSSDAHACLLHGRLHSRLLPFVGVIIRPTITKTARTSDGRRRHRQDGRLKHPRTRRSTFWRCVEPAVLIIATPGHTQPTNVGVPPSDPKCCVVPFSHRNGSGVGRPVSGLGV
jgi:hypothetical protein